MKLDLILENVRNKYNMGLLEESSLSELDVLKGKVMINESTMQIRKMLVEEGTMENIKSFLEESWSYELYEEMAVHANHPELDKTNPETAEKRKELEVSIKKDREGRDFYRKLGSSSFSNIGKSQSFQTANDYDRSARERSVTGNINYRPGSSGMKK